MGNGKMLSFTRGQTAHDNSSDHVGIHQLSDGLSLVTWFRKNKYCSIDISDHKEIRYILVILQHKIINFETTKLILPRISMYLKSYFFFQFPHIVCGLLRIYRYQ